ncbi:hypothetical protein P3T25_003407 [Paraburkholderia sp. GAS32]
MDAVKCKLPAKKTIADASRGSPPINETFRRPNA